MSSTFQSRLLITIAFSLCLAGCEPQKSATNSKPDSSDVKISFPKPVNDPTAGLNKNPLPLPKIEIESQTAMVISDKGGEIQHDGVTLTIPDGALTTATEITVQKITSDSLPPLPPGLVNVTEAGKGYRFLPAGQTFEKDVNISLPLKKVKGSPDWKALGAKTIYWDDNKRAWIPLETEMKENKIVSKSKHFTIAIASIAQAPEQAGPSAFNENAISSLAFADITSNIDFIAPPTPNNMGDARLAYPIRIPKGRGLYTPEISILYSSEGETGPLGKGWSISSSKISISTKSGVPNYIAPIYELDGIALIEVPSDGSKCQRNAPLSGEERRQLLTPTKQYVLRKDDYRKILLCNYDQPIFEVYRTNGLRFDYFPALLDTYTGSNKIAEWHLERVEDPSNNLVLYQYTANLINQRPLIKDIIYSARRDGAGNPDKRLAYYKLEFVWKGLNDNTSEDEVLCAQALIGAKRKDRKSSRIYGFETTDNTQLCRIKVLSRHGETSEWESIRSYVFKYKTSDFDDQLLLKEMLFLGAQGSQFYNHQFDYFEDSERAFSDVEWWSLDNFMENRHVDIRQSHLEKDYTRTENNSLDIGASINFQFGDIEFGCSGSTGGGWTRSEPKSRMQLRDINGDGLVDRIWTDGIYIRVALGKLGRFSSDEQQDCSPYVATKNCGISSLSKKSNESFDFNKQAGCSLFNLLQIGKNINYNWGWSNTYTTLLDVDGDGYLDLLSRSSFHRGLPQKCRTGVRSTANPNICDDDGLEVCADDKYLCFTPSPISLSTLASQQISNSSQDIFIANRSDLSRRFLFVSNDYSEATNLTDLPIHLFSNTDLPGEDHTQPRNIELLEREPEWGFYTSAKSRISSAMRTQSIPTSNIHALPIVKWVAPHDGKISVNAAFSKKMAFNDDRATVRVALFNEQLIDNKPISNLLKKIDYRANEAGTKSLWNPSNGSIDVEFGQALYFVVDTLDDAAVSTGGDPLDQIKIERLKIEYTEVCPSGLNKCIPISSPVSKHRGHNGERKYTFDYGEDFRLSDLPKEKYWHLQPPYKGGSTLLIKAAKIKKNKSDVKITVRCESQAAQAGSDVIVQNNGLKYKPVCALGTSLGVIEFKKNSEGQKKEIEIDLPPPFIEYAGEDLSKDSNSKLEGCVDYDKSTVSVNATTINAGELFSEQLEHKIGIVDSEEGLHEYFINGSQSELQAHMRYVERMVKSSDTMCTYKNGSISNAEIITFLSDSNLPNSLNNAIDITCSSDIVYEKKDSMIGSSSEEDFPLDTIILKKYDSSKGNYNSLYRLPYADKISQNQAYTVFNAYKNICYTKTNKFSSENYIFHLSNPSTQNNHNYKVFDPLRILVDIDGEDAHEVSQDSVQVSVEVNYSGRHNLTTLPLIDRDILVAEDVYCDRKQSPPFRMYPPYPSLYSQGHCTFPYYEKGFKSKFDNVIWYLNPTEELNEKLTCITYDPLALSVTNIGDGITPETEWTISSSDINFDTNAKIRFKDYGAANLFLREAKKYRSFCPIENRVIYDYGFFPTSLSTPKGIYLADSWASNFDENTFSRKKITPLYRVHPLRDLKAFENKHRNSLLELDVYVSNPPINNPLVITLLKEIGRASCRERVYAPV